MTYDYESARIYDLEQMLHAAQCRIEELDEQQVEPVPHNQTVEFSLCRLAGCPNLTDGECYQYGCGAGYIYRYLRANGHIREVAK